MAHPLDRTAYRGGVPEDIRAWENPPVRREDVSVPKFVAIPPWYVEPIPTARNFFTYTRPFVVVPAGVGSSVVVVPTQSGVAGTGGAFQIPPSNVGVLKVVSIFVDAPTVNTDLTFIFRQAQAPIPGLEEIGFAPRAAANAQFNAPGTYFLNEGVLVDCLIRNNNAFGPWNVSVTISGWFNAPEDVYRFTGQRIGNLF
jgi:hypothetical protein